MMLRTAWISSRPSLAGSLVPSSRLVVTWTTAASLKWTLTTVSNVAVVDFIILFSL